MQIQDGKTAKTDGLELQLSFSKRSELIEQNRVEAQQRPWVTHFHEKELRVQTWGTTGITVPAAIEQSEQISKDRWSVCAHIARYAHIFFSAWGRPQIPPWKNLLMHLRFDLQYIPSHPLEILFLIHFKHRWHTKETLKLDRFWICTFWDPIGSWNILLKQQGIAHCHVPFVDQSSNWNIFETRATIAVWCHVS